MSSKKKSNFVSLHNHTQIGSPLDGLNQVEDLFERAEEIGQAGFAVTDHGSQAALYDAWKIGKKRNMKFVPGCEFYFADDLTTKKNNHLVLIAKNAVGYKNLLKLGFESWKNQSAGYMGKRTPRISWEHIEKYNEGIYALTACSNGLIAKALITEQDVPKATDHMHRLKSIFNDRFYLEIQPHALLHVQKDGKEVNQGKLNQELVKYSHDLDIPYVITCDAHYRSKDHAVYHDFMLAIKDKKAVDDPDRFRYGVTDMYLKTDEEIIDFFGAEIAAKGMANSIKIFDSCDLPTYLEPRGPILPRFPVEDQADYKQFRNWFEVRDEDVEEDKGYLRYKCIENFKEKFDHFSKDKKQLYWARIKMELEVLELRGFSSYMLIVSDYFNWAKNNGIATGPGRGSVVGSLVAYVIGITMVDPIKHNLLFERFHNREKKAYPDIDLDFSKAKRSLVQDYLKTKYGADKVAHISNWSTLSPKVVMKDTARSLLLGGDKSSAFEIANHITSIMPDDKSIEEAEKKSKPFRDYLLKYPKLKEYSKPLQGLVRNWSVHAAGIVLSDQPLEEMIPLRIDEDGNVITQWEKNRCEEFGLVKMDILGIETLDLIEEALENVKVSTGKIIAVGDIPLDDEATFKMIGQGKTTGVFQLESSLTPLCMKIKPKTIDEISDINALGRPSCSAQQREDYVNRKSGAEKISYTHPVLENSLKKTYGISLYEEVMMMLAKDCAGWDLNKADSLRKITKLKGKDPEMVERTRNDFVNDSIKHSKTTKLQANEIWEKEIEPFGEYGFNAAHSVAYSYLSYQTAYLRCHYPTEFMCALLNSEDPNGDKAQEYIAACPEMGIQITPPNLNTSRGGYAHIGPGKIATGFSAIKGVGSSAVDEIFRLQPFIDFKDFLHRCNARVVNKRVIEALAKAGAFDILGVTRKDAYENYDSYRKLIQSHTKKEKSIDLLTLPGYNIEWERKELLINEKEILGRTISGSLHEVFDGFFRKSHFNITPLKKVASLPPMAKIKIEVIINSLKKEFKIKKGPKTGKKFAKYLVEDLNGTTAELTVWNSDYEKYRDILTDGIPIRAICKVDEYMGQKGLTLSTLEGVFGKNI